MVVMKQLRWTFHALQALNERKIDRAQVERVLANPELSVAVPPHRAVLMGRYTDRHLNREMLLRVVVDVNPNELVIVTVYKTSRIAKYLPGIPP